MPGLFSQCLLLCPLIVAVSSRWMPGVYEKKTPGLFSQRLLLCPFTVAVCSPWMAGLYFHKRQALFPMSIAKSLYSRSLFLMDAWRLWKETSGLFSQRLLLCPLTVAVCSRWMPGVYFHNCLDCFPNVYCYVPWQSHFVLDGFLAFIFIMPVLFSQHLLLCPLTVAVCSQWMPGIDENRQEDSFPNIYCYVLWQSQFVLDGCLAFIFINTRTLFPTSNAMSLDSCSLFSMDVWRLWK